ncbi:MAG: 8-amino-7-oxononanoate synthase [Nitrospiraceae bacterium]|nr:8-amino-7-oxononanoate synthase [Nitrospiraceae bacterium]
MFDNEMKRLAEAGLLRTPADRHSRQGAEVFLNKKPFINFASNDYLGLSGDEELIQAAVRAARDYGAGAGAARLLAGGTRLHALLEEKTARFTGRRKALLFNSGYHANLGAIPALATEGGAIFSDELNHASIIDGCRLSRAEVHVYRHRDMGHLGSLLEGSKAKGKKLVITESVFSMDGDLAPLRDICALAGEHGAMLYVDEAHAMGVFGKEGRGGLSHSGLDAAGEEKCPVLQMGTFSKAFGSYGAFIAGSGEIISWLQNSARTFIFSTALPPAVAGASLAALEIIESGRAPIKKLWENRRMLFEGIKAIPGLETGPTESPIIPVLADSVEEATGLSLALSGKGIYAPAIRPPAVKRPRLRLTVTASHTPRDISRLLDALNAAKIL